VRFDFEITEGSTVYDESYNDNNATIQNATVVTGPISDNAVSFDGVDGYMEITYNESLDVAKLDQSTFAAWVNNTNTPQSIEPVVYKQGGYRMMIDYEGSIEKNKGLPVLEMYDVAKGGFVAAPSMTPSTTVIKAPQTAREVAALSYDTAEIVSSTVESTYTDPVGLYNGSYPTIVNSPGDTTHEIEASQFGGQEAGAYTISMGAWIRLHP
jgi:hypothetical protein